MSDERQARGVWCPVLTPVDEDLSPEPVRFVAHCRRVLARGCHGLGIFGTTGEANSFSVDERISLLEEAVGAGLPVDKLMAGTGTCALSDTVRLTRHALELGIKNILALPPFYYKGNSDDALFNTFDSVIQRLGTADFNLFLYHFPKLTGVPVTPGLLERLIEAYPGTTAGVKDSSGDWDNTRDLIGRFPALAIFPGTETLLLPALEAGGAGSITATANVNAEAIRAVFDAHQRGDGSARRRQDEITAVRKVLQLRPMIPAMKALIANAEDDPGWRRVRPPLMELPLAEARALESELAGLNFRLAA